MHPLLQLRLAKPLLRFCAFHRCLLLRVLGRSNYLETSTIQRETAVDSLSIHIRIAQCDTRDCTAVYVAFIFLLNLVMCIQGLLAVSSQVSLVYELQFVEQSTDWAFVSRFCITPVFQSYGRVSGFLFLGWMCCQVCFSNQCVKVPSHSLVMLSSICILILFSSPGVGI